MRKIYVEKALVEYLVNNKISINKNKLNSGKNEWLIYIPLPSYIQNIMILGTHSETWSIIAKSYEMVSVKCTIDGDKVKYLLCTNTDIEPKLFVQNRDIYISYATNKKYCLVALNSSSGVEYDVIFDEMDFREAD